MTTSTVGARCAAETLIAAADSGDLDSICEKLGVRVLGIFGSATRDGHEPEDLDVAVGFVAAPAAPAVLELLDELTHLTSFDRIDLVTIDGTEPLIRAEAMVGIPLYEVEEGAFAVEQMAALAEMRDTAHLRALDVRALAG